MDLPGAGWADCAPVAHDIDDFTAAMSQDEWSAFFQTYYAEHRGDGRSAVLQPGLDSIMCTSVEVDQYKLCERHPREGHLLVRQPEALLPLFDQACSVVDGVDPGCGEQRRVRLVNLSPDPDTSKTSISVRGRPFPAALVPPLTAGTPAGHQTRGHVHHRWHHWNRYAAQGEHDACQAAAVLVHQVRLSVGRRKRLWVRSRLAARLSLPVPPHTPPRPDRYGDQIILPRTCPKPVEEVEEDPDGGGGQRRRPAGGRCLCTKYEEVSGETSAIDWQRISVQESTDALVPGRMPRSIAVWLEEDLVDSCKPGDRVAIAGTVLARFGEPNPKDGDYMTAKLELKANSVRLVEEGHGTGTGDRAVHDVAKDAEKYWAIATGNHDANLLPAVRDCTVPLKARNHIVESVCPHVHGLFKAKLSLLLALIGGIGRYDEDGAAPSQQGPGAAASQAGAAASPSAGKPQGKLIERAESHMLLVGDAGVGKSQLLSFAQKISPRHIMTTGSFATAAGMTAACVPGGANGGFELVAGALVLADRGVCCIDEFNCLKKEVRGVPLRGRAPHTTPAHPPPSLLHFAGDERAE